MNELFLLLFFCVLILFVVSRIRIASERHRFAEFSEEVYRGLRGPGILVKFSGPRTKWIRISVGDKITLIDLNTGIIGRISLPIKVEDSIGSGSNFRIAGFQNGVVLVSKEPD
jgi:hypothetical protein